MLRTATFNCYRRAILWLIGIHSALPNVTPKTKDAPLAALHTQSAQSFTIKSSERSRFAFAVKGLSALCLLFAIDAVVGLAQGNNMYSLKPGGGTGIAVNVATLVVCLILGPWLWRTAQAHAMQRAYAAWQAHESGAMSEAERDATVRDELRDFR